MSRKRFTRKPKPTCEDCDRPYGHENGFPDLIIPLWAWKQISSKGDESGLLCPSCICARLHEAGIKCEGAFLSGPIQTVSGLVMTQIRLIENMEQRLNEDRRLFERRVEQVVKNAGAKWPKGALR